MNKVNFLFLYQPCSNEKGVCRRRQGSGYCNENLKALQGTTFMYCEKHSILRPTLSYPTQRLLHQDPDTKIELTGRLQTGNPIRGTLLIAAPEKKSRIGMAAALQDKRHVLCC